jgi:hypothetical protein
MTNKIVGFGGLDPEESIEIVFKEPVDVLKLVREASEAELLIIQDIIKERFEADNRMTKIPDLANPEFSVFDNRKIAEISDKVIEIRRRRYTAFVYYYSHYDRSDDQMVQFIQMCNPHLSYIEAIRDLSNIKLVIGNLPRARKELIRFQVTEMHKKAYQKAEGKNDPIAMTTAANNISKANGLDKDDIDIPWDQMIPPALEPTDDISVLGKERISQEDLDNKIEKLKKRYDPDITDVEEVA